MKKLIIFFVAIVMIAGFSTRVIAQATENTAAAATIITPISLSETASLNFGTMAVLAGTAGTCILATDGSRTTGGAGGVNLSVQAPVAAAAAYTATGQAGVTYAITLPTNGTVTVINGGDNMPVNDFVSSVGASSTLTGGTENFTVGATLEVAAGQATGAYAGTFDVTVAYN